MIKLIRKTQVRHGARLEEMKCVYNILVGKPEGRQQSVGRLRQRCEYSVNTTIRK
jgi:hypothetical protein